jgi:peptidoglycan hydrolase-like protein with peptidoglycan-binding domain
MPQPDLDSACRASLDRSRRRRDIARRLRARRLRTRGGGSAFAVAAATIALAAPFAVAAGGGGSAGGLLKSGASGAAVTQIQQALGIEQTGTYDTATRGAVRAFQRAHGLEVDGIVGPATRGALGVGAAATARAASTTGGELAGAATNGASNELARIAHCESGGNPAAVSPGGRYRGKYQFSRATWRAMGGSGDPANAAEAEQDQRAAALLASAGKRPWPNCA